MYEIDNAVYVCYNGKQSSLFRHRKPRGLFRYLSEEPGVKVDQRYPGVYAVSGYHIPVQIVVTKELAEEEQSALRLS